ncbi:MAG: VWA domain-containing protein [Ardenticatenaceae bacterium]|nr:VWA domain-containing protein [Anaerolineales bacterium]MCB8921250.1 VWA domain-containing protein [Ardenticatenaceae bacterium]MCB8990616.1 VWA domain-containing protein [Ardenticatenaceae bacterium]MCB9004323.1 VWA domain-containing protein [Ardenticatenaceae bacterium]
MNVTNPLALVLLLLIPYFVWVGRPYTAVRRWREWVSLGLRLLIMLLLTLSLAGTEVVRAADELAVVFLVDASDSMSAAQAAQAETFVREAIEQMTPNDQAAVILFGANALVERPLSGLSELAPITSVPQKLHTDIAEAVRLGLALFPAGSARRLVVLSDGAATIGNAQEAAQLAAAGDVQIDTVYLPRESGAVEALVTAVSAPTRIVQGESFRIDITAESTANVPATLRVLSAGSVVYEESVDLRSGVNNFAVRLRATEQEFARYQVQLTPSEDTYYQNNELAAFTEIVGPPRVLLVANDGTLADDGTPLPDESPQLRLALEAAGLPVDQITPANFPASLAELSNYATVILVDVNAKNLTPRKMETLQSYVRDLGGGLVAVGGPESYGMGGYFRTPLEETLPVDMQIKDQERFPSVSIVIVIDRSGSMGAQEGGLTKIQLAAEGAVRVVELLNDFDDIAVIPVDTQPDNPIGPLPASQREEAIGLIRQIGAGGGGIYVRTGLEAAAEALAQSSNQVKHIILLADGADSEQKEGVPELIAALTAEGVTISTVSIGQGPDTAWLKQMAELGNGRFHFTDQAANLPQIFTQETTSIQRSYLIEEQFFPTLASGSPMLAGITAVPPLYGYVGTSPKGTAQVILESHMGDPLLAAWQYGLGRAVAWTSDATGRWGVDWVRWDGFPVFWAQVVRWTVAQGRDSNVETAVQFNEEQATLTVDARNGGGEFLNNLQMEANVVAPSGEVHNLTLQQIAPGRYAAEFVPQTDGAYFIRVAGTEAGEGDAVVGQTSGWVLGYSPEYLQFETSPVLLENMAALTSGRDLSGEGGGTAVFDHSLPSQAATRPIWPWLTLLAVALLPLDIATRRLVITRRDWQRAWAATFGRWQRQPVVAAERSEPMSRLFAAKERAGETREETAAQPVVFVKKEEKAGETAVPSPKPPPSPSQPIPPKRATPPTSSGTLASRLLEKKRNQDGDEG